MSEIDFNKLQLQQNEFVAADKFMLAIRAHQVTAVVEDDYPRVRYEYESALASFIDSMAANGRFAAGTRHGLTLARHDAYKPTVVPVFFKSLEGVDLSTAEASPPNVEVEQFLDEVRAELTRARAKFPGDRIMTIALLEEAGELAKALLEEPAERVRKEAVQTAVMAARIALDGDGSVREWREQKGLDKVGGK